ncbi:MAG: MATE family efflux transporter, partial [Clostridiales bacterium]|nr:MATE family efflux transporter [Clostridiales bacterium]
MKQFALLLKDKDFLRKTMAITIPIALQNLLNNVLNMIDTLMIGRLGETAVAAVGLANKVFFVFCLLMFGISSGASVLASQYWGKGEPIKIRKVLHISLLIGLGASILFMMAGLLFPEIVMRIFTPEQETIAAGATYLVIIALSYPLTAVTMVYVAILRSMNYVKLPVIITLISIAVNGTLNYGLIFGKLGLPEMGIAGAALATLIARIVECGALLIIVYMHKAGDNALGDFVHGKENREGDQKTPIFTKGFVMKYLITATPVIMNEFMWGLGVTMYSLVYGRMGNAVTAAITIESTVEQGITVFFFGICSAASVILGNVLGANQLEKAEEYAKKFITLQICLSVIGSLLTILIREPIIAWFAQSDEVAGYISQTLIIFALFLPMRMINTLLIIAIFRSGGDTKAALFLDATSVWLIGIPLAVLGGLVLKLPLYIVFTMINMEQIYKFVLA